MHSHSLHSLATASILVTNSEKRTEIFTHSRLARYQPPSKIKQTICFQLSLGLPRARPLTAPLLHFPRFQPCTTLHIARHSHGDGTRCASTNTRHQRGTISHLRIQLWTQNWINLESRWEIDGWLFSDVLYGFCIIVLHCNFAIVVFV